MILFRHIYVYYIHTAYRKCSMVRSVFPRDVCCAHLALFHAVAGAQLTWQMLTFGNGNHSGQDARWAYQI